MCECEFLSYLMVTRKRYALRDNVTTKRKAVSMKDKNDEMSRYDWFLLGTTMAFLMDSQMPNRRAHDEAQKITDRLMQITEERKARLDEHDG